MNFVPESIEHQALAGNSDAQVQLAEQLNRAGHRGSAEKWLRRAASSGGAEAMLALGQHLLASPAPASRSVIDEGRRLVFSAADAGNGPAAYFAALLSAIDGSAKEHFSTALRYLTSSAGAGHPAAQAELAVLSGDERVRAAMAKGDPLSTKTWVELGRSVDLQQLQKVPPIRIEAEAPYIAVVEKFIATEICDWLIARAQPKLEQAKTYNSTAVSESRVLAGRAIALHSAASPELDLVLLPVLHRISVLTGIGMNGMEPTSVLHYAEGQEYQPHYDFLDPAVPSFAAQIAKTGQRMATVLIYLNDDYEGGETDFPRLGYRFKGRKGDALIFRNVSGDGTPDRRTLHAGLPPMRGEKWLFARACTSKQA